MFENQSDDIDELFKAFGAVHPDPDLSDQAVERTREALFEQSLSTPSSPRSWWIQPMTRRTLTAAALLLPIVAALSLFFGNDRSALAQLQKRLRSIQSITFQTQLRYDGKPTDTIKVWLRSDDRMRSEHSDGRWEVTHVSKDGFSRLHVSPKDKTARMVHGLPSALMKDAIGMILDLPSNGDSEKLPPRQIDGKSYPGIQFRQTTGGDHTQQVRVWFDSTSGLPIHVEHQATLQRGGNNGAEVIAIAISDGFQYDLPIDDAKFSLKAPEGYAVTTEGTPAGKRRAPMPLAKLELIVGQGIGEARFGMSRDEVAEIVGEPAKKSKVTPKVREGFPTPELEIWEYPSEGVPIDFFVV